MCQAGSLSLCLQFSSLLPYWMQNQSKSQKATLKWISWNANCTCIACLSFMWQTIRDTRPYCLLHCCWEISGTTQDFLSSHTSSTSMAVFSCHIWEPVSTAHRTKWEGFCQIVPFRRQWRKGGGITCMNANPWWWWWGRLSLHVEDSHGQRRTESSLQSPT